MSNPTSHLAALAVLLACSGSSDRADNRDSAGQRTSKVSWTSVKVPPYKVVARVKLLTGGAHGDILVPSARPGMSPDSLASIAQAIASREKLTEADFYRTEAARNANLSGAYAKLHPGELEQGFLGSLKDRQFTPTR